MDEVRLPQYAGSTLGGDLTTANGTVKWYSAKKGFGFIAPDSGGKGDFVHASALERSGLTGLQDKQKVSSDVESGRDGRESSVNLKLT